MKRWHRLAAALAVLAPIAAAAAEPTCVVPPSLLETAATLPEWSVAALDRASPLRIVALGSGTTKGLGASTPAASFPARLEVALRARVGARVTVLNQGVQRETANDMMARLDRDVLAHKPHLVIWETGTVDAVRGVPLDDFGALLEAGVAHIREAGADVLLVNPQYARAMPRVVNLLPFVEAMRTFSASQDVMLFDRFEVMRYWVDNDVFHLDESVAPRLVGAEIDAVYDCIGQLIARMIIDATPDAALAAK